MSVSRDKLKATLDSIHREIQSSAFKAEANKKIPHIMFEAALIKLLKQFDKVDIKTKDLWDAAADLIKNYAPKESASAASASNDDDNGIANLFEKAKQEVTGLGLMFDDVDADNKQQVSASNSRAQRANSQMSMENSEYKDSFGQKSELISNPLSPVTHLFSNEVDPNDVRIHFHDEKKKSERPQHAMFHFPGHDSDDDMGEAKQSVQRKVPKKEDVKYDDEMQAEIVQYIKIESSAEQSPEMTLHFLNEYSKKYIELAEKFLIDVKSELRKTEVTSMQKELIGASKVLNKKLDNVAERIVFLEEQCMAANKILLVINLAQENILKGEGKTASTLKRSSVSKAKSSFLSMVNRLLPESVEIAPKVSANEIFDPFNKHDKEILSSLTKMLNDQAKALKAAPPASSFSSSEPSVLNQPGPFSPRRNSK
jgi:hypothetical protein